MEKRRCASSFSGDYLERYLFKKNREITDDINEAVYSIIRECKDNGTLIQEYYGFMNCDKSKSTTKKDK